MSNDDTATTRTEKGISLARGPALILGTILQVAGLYFLYKQHLFPKLSNFPNGNVPAPGKAFLGIFGANGWTGLLTTAAGGLLLFGAAEHLLAKTMSVIVGIALGAAAITALISGNVLGFTAADGWTEILWGGSAAILMFSTLLPRRKKTVEDDSAAAVPRRRQVDPAPVVREQSCRAVPGAERGNACGDSRDQATARVCSSSPSRGSAAWPLSPQPRQADRQMTAAARVMIDSGDAAQRRLMAERSAFSLPYRQLLRHTQQPLTDLAERHHQPLIDAVLEDAGIRRRPRQPDRAMTRSIDEEISEAGPHYRSAELTSCSSTRYERSRDVNANRPPTSGGSR